MTDGQGIVTAYEEGDHACPSDIPDSRSTRPPNAVPGVGPTVVGFGDFGQLVYDVESFCAKITILDVRHLLDPVRSMSTFFSLQLGRAVYSKITGN